jgi:uncharacterized protein YbaR (Trm112 family)
MPKPLPPDLLAILACPQCRQPLREEAESLRCTNPECRLRYPVRDGIPVLLVEEAKRDDAP